MTGRHTGTGPVRHHKPTRGARALPTPAPVTQLLLHGPAIVSAKCRKPSCTTYTYLQKTQEKQNKRLWMRLPMPIRLLELSGGETVIPIWLGSQKKWASSAPFQIENIRVFFFLLHVPLSVPHLPLSPQAIGWVLSEKRFMNCSGADRN